MAILVVAHPRHTAMAIALLAVVAHAATGITERDRNAITGREREHMRPR